MLLSTTILKHIEIDLKIKRRCAFERVHVININYDHFRAMENKYIN